MAIFCYSIASDDGYLAAVGFAIKKKGFHYPTRRVNTDALYFEHQNSISHYLNSMKHLDILDHHKFFCYYQ